MALAITDIFNENQLMIQFCSVRFEHSHNIKLIGLFVMVGRQAQEKRKISRLK